MQLKANSAFTATFGGKVYQIKKAGEKIAAEGLDAKRLIALGLASIADEKKGKNDER